MKQARSLQHGLGNMNAAKSNDIGSLRNLQEQDWNRLNIPLMCRLYLKHVILQSCALTTLSNKSNHQKKKKIQKKTKT